MPRTIRALVAALATAGCGGRAAGEHIEHVELTSCGGIFTASPDGSAIAYVDGHDLVVVNRGAATRIASPPGCDVAGASSIAVDDGGARVALWGTAPNHFNMWDDPGHHVTAACVVQVATAKATPLPEIGPEPSVEMLPIAQRVLMWERSPATTLVVADGGAGENVPLPGGRCAVAPIGAGMVEAVCDSLQAVVVRRIQLAPPAAAGADVTMPHREVGNGGGIALAADGHTFVYWGSAAAGAKTRNRVVYVDLQRRTDAVVYDREDDGELLQVVPDPRGSGELLLAINATVDPDHLQIDLARVSPTGKLVAEHVVHQGGNALYWTEPGAVWAVGPCAADHVTL